MPLSTRLMTGHIACLALVVLTCWAAPASAQADNDFLQGFLRHIETTIFPLVLAERPAVERNRARGIRIRYHDDYLARDLVVANATTREITVSSGFMLGLRAYSEAFLVEAHTGQQHFREWYFHYLLSRNPLHWDGGAPDFPADFYGLPESQTKKALYGPGASVDLIFSAAFIEVMLHELGHIATNAVYSVNASNSFKLRQEIKADSWARVAAAGLDDRSGIGRMVAMGYLHELERYYGFGGTIYSTHPSTQQRFKVYVDRWCNTEGQLAERVCKIYSAEYEQTFSTERQIEKYRARAESGEAHASIKLGDAYLRGTTVSRDLRRACGYYKQAYDKGDRNIAALNYGWCLGQGHLGYINIPLARTILQRARQKGWKYADALLAGF